MESPRPRLIYCHCQYAQVIPAAVKNEVLRRLCAAGVDFEAAPDLCEMSARQDPLLRQVAGGGPAKIAACFPRAVKWLFAAGDAPLNLEQAEVINMRNSTADEVVTALLQTPLQPNMPFGKETLSAPAPAGHEGQPAIEHETAGPETEIQPEPATL